MTCITAVPFVIDPQACCAGLTLECRPIGGTPFGVFVQKPAKTFITTYTKKELT